MKVPSAGQRIASGSGIQRAVKHAGKAKVVTIEVGLSPNYRHAAEIRRLDVRVKTTLLFKPGHGKALYAQTMLLLR